MLSGVTGPYLPPGANRSGAASGADWTYLLDRLEHEHALSLGLPSGPALTTLARLNEAVTVVGRGRLDRLRFNARCQRSTGVGRVAVGRDSRLPLSDGSVDVALVIDEAWIRRLALDRRLAAELRRVMRPSGVIYLQDPWPRGNSAVLSLPAGLMWIRTSGGEVRVAVPAGDRQTISYVEATTTTGGATSWQRRLRRRVQGRAQREVVGRSVLLSGAARSVDHPPPGYLCEMAAQAGVPIDGHRWALRTPEQYRSKKVLFFLFRDDDPMPEYVVKLTRDPCFNGRLENEWRVLKALQEFRLARGRAPTPMFAGHHGGLAVLGQTAIGGSAFTSKTTALPTCPYAAAATSWLVDLGLKSADATAATARDIAAGLGIMLDRFIETYRPALSLRRFLTGQIQVVQRSGMPFPLVFQHGDPGAWNLMVDDGGRPVFLDWEAADPRGMPLWDLFYFVRSHGILVSRAAGASRSLPAWEQQFLPLTPLSELLAQSVERFCAEANLERGLVEPLFHLCWVHRALKEASRLSPATLHRGRYVNLLYRGIEARTAPGLRRLFHLEAEAGRR